MRRIQGQKLGWIEHAGCYKRFVTEGSEIVGFIDARMWRRVWIQTEGKGPCRQFITCARSRVFSDNNCKG